MTAPLPGWYPDPPGAPGQRYVDGRRWTYRAPSPSPPPTPPPTSIVINNTVAAPTHLVVSPGPNHALHLVLTLLTCGMWLPVWLVVAVAGGRQPANAGGRPLRGVECRRHNFQHNRRPVPAGPSDQLPRRVPRPGRAGRSRLPEIPGLRTFAGPPRRAGQDRRPRRRPAPGVHVR